MDDLLEYKNGLLGAISLASEEKEVFPEESFFEYVSELLSSTGILDNVDYCPYRNSSKGIRVDGLSWNSLEKTICGIVVDLSNDPESVGTLAQAELDAIGKRVVRFINSAIKDSFLNLLEVTDPGRVAALDVREYLKDALKVRVVVFTDRALSARVRSLSLDEVQGCEGTLEVWDLERLMGLESSGAEYEEFTVDVTKYCDGIRALPANVSEEGVSTYLAVMPGALLSSIYDEFGQRLLESNVRTFLDFKAGTNRGMRKSLLSEPESFFAYNNGLTVTASSIETEEVEGQLLITSLENMQIVNGGQTTAAIYFSPRDKGGIKGKDGMLSFSEIDLDRVHVQMKLTVIEDRETAGVMKANIATFANSQNSIQQSDLVSNHPFHLNLETRSRKQLMPAGDSGLATKWFYERARGQYSTALRGRSGGQKRKFEAEYPKRQLFNKTDMAKYENTWRMNPHIVKKGAQSNLKALGAVIIKEYEKNEEAFGAAFFQDLVSKAILFRGVDTAILQADWYKEDRGLKAEMVTYGIALLRHSLLARKEDIDLSSIYKRQSVSEPLLATIIALARRIRGHITDLDFTGGVANPSEFCKSDKGWKKIQGISVNLDSLEPGDIHSAEQSAEAGREKRELDKASKTITALDYFMKVSALEWDEIAAFNHRKFPMRHRNVGIPEKCASAHRLGDIPSDKQMKLAKEIREEAKRSGFDFIDG
jgi:hypothetical protein